MICPTCRGRQFVAEPADDDESPRMKPCPDCIGGIASCCDAAGATSFAASNEDEKSIAPSFTCPRCGAVSYNPNDIRERYCGRCHVFVDDEAERRRNLFDGYSEAEIERSQRRIAAILGELPDDAA